MHLYCMYFSCRRMLGFTASILYVFQLPENVTNDMHQVVEPHNDYFTCQFLLSFPAPGLHVVNIEAAVVDESGGTWRTGPCSSINVKSYDEVLQRQQQYARSQVPRPPPIASASQF